MESMQDGVTLADLESHVARHGKKATSKLLELLGRRKPAYDIIMSPGGSTLFSRVIFRLDELLDLIIEEKASDKDLMEYKTKVEFLRYSTDILKNYEKYRKMLKGSV